MIKATVINWVLLAGLIIWIISYYPNWKAQKEAEGQRAKERKMALEIKKAAAIAKIESDASWRVDSLKHIAEMSRIGGGAIEVKLR